MATQTLDTHSHLDKVPLLTWFNHLRLSPVFDAFHYKPNEKLDFKCLTKKHPNNPRPDGQGGRSIADRWWGLLGSNPI